MSSSDKALLYNVCQAALLGSPGVILQNDVHYLQGTTSFGSFVLDNYLDDLNQAVDERATEEDRLRLLTQGTACFMIQYSGSTNLGYMILRLEDLKDGMVKRPILTALHGGPSQPRDIIVFDGGCIIEDPFNEQPLREAYEYLTTPHA